jgi:spore germination cell wall hydrolase CwlJ-like protein
MFLSFICTTFSGMKMAIADQQAHPILSPQFVDAYSKALIQEMAGSNALADAMAAALEGRFTNVATHEDVAAVQEELQGDDPSSAAMLFCNFM